MSDDFEKLYALRVQEFVETFSERLTYLEKIIAKIVDGIGNRGEHYAEFIGEVHTIKGSAGTFGFPIVTTIAHRLEDYLESSRRLNRADWADVQAFLDEISKILDKGRDPDKEQHALILSGLPSIHVEDTLDDNIDREVVLLIMPRGVVRTMVGRVLIKAGFDVSYSNDSVESFALAVSLKPDLILCSQVFSNVQGNELSMVFKVLPQTISASFVLLTSQDHVDTDIVIEGKTIANDIDIIYLDSNLQNNLTTYLDAYKLIKEMA